MSDLVGQQLGHYRLLRLLGEGSFAMVYLGQPLHLETQVAIKVLRWQLASEEVEPFRREAALIARLTHPHLVRVLDFGVQGSTPFLVLEYTPNGTLRQRHPPGSRVDLATVVSYVQQIAPALHYAHEQHLLHGNLKPENLLVGANQQVLLSDCGMLLLAQRVRASTPLEAVGTPSYLSPEQIQGRSQPASDQYALAILVYEWLTGQPPFQGSFAELGSQHLFATPASLQQQLPTLPAAVEQVVLTALAKDARQRFASVQDFATAFVQASALPVDASLPASQPLSPTAALPAQPSAITLGAIPLVDRQREWAQLQQLWQQAVVGRVELVVLTGEAGAGKTRLAEELLARVGQQAMSIARAHCYQVEGEQPYAPVAVWLHADALRTNLSNLPVLWLTEVARFVPELLVERPSLPPPGPLTESWQRQRLFEALARAMLAAHQPTLLLIDDLQWCDQETLAWLHYLLRFDPQARLLIVGTLRAEELTSEHPLQAFLGTLHREGQVTEIALGPLNATETADLATKMTGRELDPALTARLYQDTEGNPLFVVEILRMGLEAAGELEPRTGEETATAGAPLPPTIQAVISGRLKQLSPQAREVAGVAAVIGRAFSFELLAQLSKNDEEALLGALDELWQRHIIVEHGTDAYDFSHGKIREVTYADLPTPRRRLLHRRTLEILQAASAPPAELAHHASAAGLYESAFHFSLAAGDRAAELFARADARMHYARALEALSHLPDSETAHRRRVDTILKLVKVSWNADDPQHTLARLAEAEVLAQNLPDPQDASGSDRLRLARVHFWISQVHVTRNEMREAMRYLQQVLVLAQEVGDEELQALASVQIGRALVAQGHFGKGKSLLTQAATLLEKAGNWSEWMFAAGFLGIALAASGQYAAGVAQGQSALARAQQMKTPLGIAMSNICLSAISLLSGEIADMLEESRTTAAVAEQSSNPFMVYLGYAFRGWAESRLGNHGAAMQSMAHSRAVAQKIGGQLLIADWVAAAYAEIVLAAGQIEKALTLAEEAVKLAQAIGGLFAEGLAQRVWGQALAFLNPPRWDEAEAHLSASLHTLETCEAIPEVARTHLAWGLLCRDRSDTSVALKHFEAAAAQFESAGLTRELERTGEEIAKCKR